MHLRIEIVYDANPEAVVHQGVYKMRAYKSRPADDDNAHRTVSLCHAPNLRFALSSDISGIGRRRRGKTSTRLIVVHEHKPHSATDLPGPPPTIWATPMVRSSRPFGTFAPMRIFILSQPLPHRPLQYAWRCPRRIRGFSK